MENKLEINKEEIELLKEILEQSYENDYFKGDFNVFEDYSDIPKKDFLKKANILKGVIEKIKKLKKKWK